MPRSESRDIPPLKLRRGQPIFDEAWQARMMGLVSELAREEARVPSSFRAQSLGTLGTVLEGTAAPSESEETQIDYVKILRLLETLLVDNGVLSEADIGVRIDRWKAAYENTPHGKPVLLSATDEVSVGQGGDDNAGKQDPAGA